VLCPWRGTDCVPAALRRRASRPQLKREPLGTHGVPITSSTLGLVLFLVAGGVYLALMQRLSHHRAANTGPWWLESWTKGLAPGTYTEEGQQLLKRLLPWILALFAIEIVGVTIFVASS